MKQFASIKPKPLRYNMAWRPASPEAWRDVMRRHVKPKNAYRYYNQRHRFPVPRWQQYSHWGVHTEFGAMPHVIGFDE